MPKVPGSAQNFRKSSPCPICAGYDEAPRGKGVRCSGFLSSDGHYAHCSREEYAGGLTPDANGRTYHHRLVGDCTCGVRHDPRPDERASRNGHEPRTIVTTYNYVDEQGTLLFQAVRYRPKGFTQRRPDGKRGWISDLEGVRRVLYCLPEVLEAIATGQTIVIPEGEKDADALRQRGYVATCNPMGARKWREEYSQTLKEAADVVLLGDNDDDGRAHVAQVVASLRQVGLTPRLAQMDGLPPHGDVSDWLKSHSQEDLDRLIAEATPLPEASVAPVNGQPSTEGLPLTCLRDLLDEPEEAVAWLMEGTLPSGGFSLLVAKPKVGKSTLARCLALAVAHGAPFLGRATTQGPVIYLALEEKRAEVKRHFRVMGAKGDEPIYLYASTAPADALQRIRVSVERTKPALLIIDPLFRLTRVKDGNDYAQVTQALEPLLALARETGTHVLCVHHEGKGDRQGGDAILGSTAIFAAVDTAMMLKRRERYRTITSIQRYGDDLEETTLGFDDSTKTISLGETREREEEARIGEGILEFLQTKRESVIEAVIDEEVEGRRAIRKRALRRLVQEGRIVKEGKGGKGDPFTYGISGTQGTTTPDREPWEPEFPPETPRQMDLPTDETFLVPRFPPIYREPEYQNPKSDVTVQKPLGDSGSHGFAKTAQGQGKSEAGGNQHADRSWPSPQPARSAPAEDDLDRPW